jgi:hypothetical protein
LHRQGQASQRGQHLFGWRGSTSNNKGDSVGEGFSILRIPVIVPEQRTFEVEIPENLFQTLRLPYLDHVAAQVQ